MGFAGSFATSITGLSVGAMTGQLLRAFFTGKEYQWSEIPFIIVIGSFISLMFIYRDHTKIQIIENAELNAYKH